MTFQSGAMITRPEKPAAVADQGRFAVLKTDDQKHGLGRSNLRHRDVGKPDLSVRSPARA
jgi:hypothetical protein